MKKNEKGLYYKTIRLYKEISKKDVCEQCGISVQYLTKLEDEVNFLSINPDTDHKILTSLGVNYFYDVEYINSFIEKFNQFVQDCFYCRDNDAIRIFKCLNAEEATIENTLIFPQYILLLFIYNVLFDKDNEQDEFIRSILKKIDFHFEGRLKQIYYLYLGIYYKNSDNLTEAYHYLKEALRIMNNNENLSMIFYHLGIIGIKRGKDLEAFVYNMKAKNLFSDLNNFVRTAQCLSHQGLVCFHLKEYSNGIQYCKEAIVAAKTLDNHPIIAVNYQNLSWIYLLTKQYENVIENVEKAISYGRKDNILYFHRSFALYKLKQPMLAKSWVEKGLSEILNKRCLEYRLLKMTENILLKKKNQEKALEETIQYITHSSQQHDIDIMRLLYQELIDCKKEKGKYEEAFRYYEIMENLH